jgi:MFS family permease
VLIELFGVQNLGAILDIFFTASGISAVLGPLSAGFSVDATGSYQWGIAFALAAGTLGFAAVALLRIPGDEGYRTSTTLSLRITRPRQTAEARSYRLAAQGHRLRVSRPTLILIGHLFCPDTAIIFVCLIAGEFTFVE